MYSKLNRVLGALIIRIIIVSFFPEALLTNKIGYYTIVAPGTIRSEAFFHVSITLNDFHRSCWFNITLKNYNQTSQLYGYEGIEIEPRTTRLIKLRAPYLTDKLGHLEVFGYRGIASRDSTLINFEANSYATFIQINKAKFKPGELVEFRVICIDQLTRPAKVNHKLFVKIYDGEDNLLKLVCDVKLVQGVFRSEFQISDYPVLGEWQIKVENDGDVVAEKSFEVERYELPNFSVEIKTNPNVAIDEGKITLEVSSSYFYGEPVKGNLTISLRSIYENFQDNIPVFKRKLQIDGNDTIILDIKNDLHLKTQLQNQRSVILYKLNVEAIVIDEISEQQSWTEVELTIHSQAYKIKLEAPELFEPDEIIILKIKVSVTDLHDNPIHDSQNSIKIFIKCQRYNSFKSEYIFQVGTDQYHSVIKINNAKFSRCNLHAEFRGSKSSVKEVHKNVDSLYLETLTESPEVGKELEIKLKSLNLIRNFSYEIVSRGDIIQSELIMVPENQTSFIVRFNVTFLMAPKITIYIHGIENRNFIGQCKDIYIKQAFKNSITISTDKETKPGSSVNINVTTDEGSYVGLMGLDERILQNNQVEDDLTENYFYTELRNYDSISFQNSKYSPGIQAGLVTFSNAQMPLRVLTGWGIDDEKMSIASGDSGGGVILLPEKFDKPILEFPFVRKIFSESWLYKDFERIPAKGLNFIETIPDTITTWAITGFSLNPYTGLTLTREATKLKVFQEFFISMDLPSLVREGEMIEVPIYIRHYMKQGVWTNVTINVESEDLEVLEHAEDASNSKKEISKVIFTNKLKKIKFYLKPRKRGEYRVLVKAVSSQASDAIQKTLNVQSQGIPYAMSKTYLVHLPEESSQNDEITIDIPEEAVPESQRVEISVVGDIFRPLLKSLQKMERVPYGNGEDNMKYIVSNLLVLKYLKALNYSKPSLESKIKLNLELGYQNQLSFKHLDGSFGLFERTLERTGNIWQTAFALWGLKQASDFIQIDFKIIKRGLKYLKSKQQKNGCFESKKDIQEDVKYTGFALIAFLMDNFSKSASSEVISRGLQCLYDMSNRMKQSSNSVMSAYVLTLGKHERAEDILEKLINNRRISTRKKQMRWTKPDTIESNFETTVGSLINLFEAQNHKLSQSASMLQIAKEFFNSEAKSSSINPMIALTELIGFIGNLKLDRRNLNITFRDDHKGFGTFQVNPENSQVLQTLKISRRSRKINFQSRGHGFAMIMVKYKYNLVCEDQYSSALTTNITTWMSSTRTSFGLQFCPSILKNNSQSGNLIVMEITLQSGFLFSEKSLIRSDDNLQKGIKSIQINGNRDMAVVYLENIDEIGTCFKLKAFKQYKLLNPKPGWVIVHDAYDKDLRTVKSFKITDGQ